MRFLPAATLALALSTPVLAFDPAAMSETERAAFRAEVRAYLLENPEVLIEAMDVLRARDAEAEAAQDAQVLAQVGDRLENDGISWVGGNPDGDITVVEFLDYRCGYCRRAHDEVKALLAEDGNIRWVVKEFPILGPDSEQSSRLAIATLQVLGDEAYGRLHDVLMTFEGPVNDQTLPIIAKRAEIDLAAVQDRMTAAEVSDHIAEVRTQAQMLGLSGTPSFTIGSTILRGYLPKDGMMEIVAGERDKRG